MKIKSIGDVITNSSSEVFVIRVDNKEEYVEDLFRHNEQALKDYRDCFSGDAQELEIEKSYDDILEIRIDQGFESTSAWIRKTAKQIIENYEI